MTNSATGFRPTNDRFLIGIIAGVAVLVVAAFAIALSHPAPAYRDDDTPEAAAHNYFLALQRKDYTRAWGYLAPTLPGYPKSVEDFRRDVTAHGWPDDLANVELRVDKATLSAGGTNADVTGQRTDYYNRGLFDSGQSTDTFTLFLRREGGSWKILSSDELWWYCWSNPDDSCHPGRVPEPARP